MNPVKQFYDQLQFPGHYTIDGLNYHINQVKNPYLKLIDRYIEDGVSVIDVGCGTGLISNLFALKYPTAQFTAIDFANSVIYGRNFARQNKIKNVKFERADITKYAVKKQYDIVICQGVLHHIPDIELARSKLDQLVKPGGKLILGLYHPWGKILKKFYNINYKNSILYKDQEHNPYERAYNFSQVKSMFPGYDFETAYPYLLNKFIAMPSFFNYRNGGLVTYILEKSL